MIKTGRIETGRTPSEQSGKPSVRIMGEQALAKGETPEPDGLAKIAAAMESPDED